MAEIDTSDGKNKNRCGEVKKLGLFGLSAIVFGSMVGTGIFNLAQNMGSVSSVGAVIVSWLITAVGMLTLVFTFKVLADKRPDLNAGIYQYTEAGFGRYLGFNISWGYWLCAASGNVAYAVMLNDALGMFFPVLLEHGWQSLLVDSAFIWVMFAVVNRGVHSASVVNSTITLVKIVALLLIVALFCIYFDTGLFTSSFWGRGLDLGGVGEQIRGTMLVTLWCFVGIEGAVVMSARAKRSSDVGKAGVIGFSFAWVLYLLVSCLCYGLLSQPELAGLENPSVAYVLKEVCGAWAYYFVAVSVITAQLGGWVAWTIMCAEVPYEASRVKMMPPQFLKLNSRGAPTRCLFISTIAMQVLIVVVMASESVYMAAVEITSMMVLPAYLFSGLFLCKASMHDGRGLCRSGARVSVSDSRRYLLLGVFCTVYCLWLIYAAGIDLLMKTAVLYIPGVFFYIAACRSYNPGMKVGGMFTWQEKCLCAFLFGCAIVAIILSF